MLAVLVELPYPFAAITRTATTIAHSGYSVAHSGTIGSHHRPKRTGREDATLSRLFQKVFWQKSFLFYFRLKMV